MVATLNFAENLSSGTSSNSEMIENEIHSDRANTLEDDLLAAIRSDQGLLNGQEIILRMCIRQAICDLRICFAENMRHTPGIPKYSDIVSHAIGGKMRQIQCRRPNDISKKPQQQKS